jgi:hypothetical protein
MLDVSYQNSWSLSSSVTTKASSSPFAITPAMDHERGRNSPTSPNRKPMDASRSAITPLGTPRSPLPAFIKATARLKNAADPTNSPTDIQPHHSRNVFGFSGAYRFSDGCIDQLCGGSINKTLIAITPMITAQETLSTIPSLVNAEPSPTAPKLTTSAISARNGAHNINESGSCFPLGGQKTSIVMPTETKTSNSADIAHFCANLGQFDGRLMPRVCHTKTAN